MPQNEPQDIYPGPKMCSWQMRPFLNSVHLDSFLLLTQIFLAVSHGDFWKECLCFHSQRGIYMVPILAFKTYGFHSNTQGVMQGCLSSISMTLALILSISKPSSHKIAQI